MGQNDHAHLLTGLSSAVENALPTLRRSTPLVQAGARYLDYQASVGRTPDTIRYYLFTLQRFAQ